MELSDFAERILYGTDLDEKLLSPESMTDFMPRSITHIPDYPGRPQALRLQGDGPRHKVPFPGLHQLEDHRTRGHVLHFFANHELLALELMALMLLRFPDAPASFRKGIYHTMVEEQGHLRMYKERMEHAQVEFGEIPVNAFFWRVLRDMHSPMDFITGMSMTFEQANLDYAGYYARAFRRIGDIETADVLDIVYEEEIGHVHHGVIWFDRWKPKERSRFRAFEVLLPEGLSPIRAKGMDFDIQARQKAGLDDDFIARLRVYRASKGRPPWVLWFNPSAEHESRVGYEQQVPKVFRQTAQDLGLLMSQLASEEDILLVERACNDKTRAYLDGLGLPLPALVELSEDASIDDAIEARHIGRLMPWGVSPRAKHRFKAIEDRLVESAQEERSGWNAGIRIWGKDELHEVRKTVLQELTVDETNAYASRLIRPESVGELITEVSSLHREVLSESAVPRIIKAPKGTSGRGAIRVFKPTLSENHTRWVEKTIDLDGAVVVEPWRERVIDLSWHMDVGKEQTTHYGSQRFLTDPRGQYLGTVLHRATEGLDTQLVRWIHDDGRSSRWMRTLHQRAADRVAEYLRQQGYRGPVGIDAMVYREEGELRFHPLVEVNTRWTMGRVAFELEKRVSRRRSAVMLIVPKASIEAKHSTLHDARVWAESTYPATVVGSGAERGIDGGVVWLTDTEQAIAHVPVLLVAESWDALCVMAADVSDFAKEAVGPLRPL